MPTRVAGNVTISTFEVGGTPLVARLERKDGTPTCEIPCCDKPADPAPGVKSFPLKRLLTAERTKTRMPSMAFPNRCFPFPLRVLSLRELALLLPVNTSIDSWSCRIFFERPEWPCDPRPMAIQF